MKKALRIVAIIFAIPAAILTLMIAAVVVIGLLSPVEVFVNDTDKPITIAPLHESESRRIFRTWDSKTIAPGKERKQVFDWEGSGTLAVLSQTAQGTVIFCPPVPQQENRYDWISALIFQPVPMDVYRWSRFVQSPKPYTDDISAVGACTKI